MEASPLEEEGEGAAKTWMMRDGFSSCFVQCIVVLVKIDDVFHGYLSDSC